MSEKRQFGALVRLLQRWLQTGSKRTKTAILQRCEAMEAAR